MRVIDIADRRALRGVGEEEYEKWKEIVKLLRISHSENYLFFIGIGTGGWQGHPPTFLVLPHSQQYCTVTPTF